MQFAAGDLSPAQSLMVSAHLDMCPKCRRLVASFTESLADETLKQDGVDSQVSNELDSMLASITAQPVSKAAARESIVVPNTKFIELDGRQFALPRALGRYHSKVGNWSKLVGKLWQAPVEIGGIGKAHFIYMEKGGSVPEHTHRGGEHTLVLDGEFSDGISEYDTGDIMYMDGSHVHTPVSHADEGCLVFSIVDQPLHFTSGLARLLNPFSHLFFK